jgi:hypothetical protein
MILLNHKIKMIKHNLFLKTLRKLWRTKSNLLEELCDDTLKSLC